MKKTFRIDSTRLKNWDYSSEGAYYITLITKNREHSFGRVENGTMILSEIGQIAHNIWYQIPAIYPMAILDEFVIMPNHIHGIIFIDYRGCTNMPRHIATIPKFSKPIKNSISMIINHYKGNITKSARKTDSNFKWQSLFHDHIIRDKGELNRIRKYIIDNPLNFGKKLKQKQYEPI
ncbi:MAG: transposase [Bacteroidia bacterium]|nr:transposase [Bacteroidia bacterium]